MRATWFVSKGKRIAEILAGIPSDIEFVKWLYEEWKGNRK